MVDKLRELRTQLGLTQKALGEQVGVSRQAINALETGKHDPSLDLAFRLSGVFAVSVEEIFFNPYAANKHPAYEKGASKGP